MAVIDLYDTDAAAGHYLFQRNDIAAYGFCLLCRPTGGAVDGILACQYYVWAGDIHGIYGQQYREWTSDVSFLAAATVFYRWHHTVLNNPALSKADGPIACGAGQVDVGAVLTKTDIPRANS